MRLAVLLAMAFLYGCAHESNRYSVAPANLDALRYMVGKSVGVGEFVTSPHIDSRKIECGAMAVTPSDNLTIADYFRNALIDELRTARVYAKESNVVLNGFIEEISLDAGAFQTMGTWKVTLRIQSTNGKSVKDSSSSAFRMSAVSTYCELSARSFSNAVQDSISRIVTHPDFQSLVHPL